MIKAHHLSEEEIILYYKSHNLNVSDLYCKDCGKLLIYDNAYIYYAVNKDNTFNYDKLISIGSTFMSTRIYNNNEYKLCRCKECVSKKYPNILTHKYLYAQKGSFSTKYAFNVSDEDFSIVSKKCNARTKENMITTFGENKGIEKWNAYINKQSYTNTFEYKHEKYGMTLEEFNLFNKSRATTLENLVKRYGETKGKEKWNEYCERLRYTNSLNYFKEKYGDTIGLQKYLLYEKQKTSFSGASHIANSCFDELTSMFFENDEIYYDKHNYEYSVNGYRVDFYDKTKNIAIEFFGDLFHANPLKYSETNLITNIYNSQKIMSAKDIWEHDKKRLEYIKQILKCKVLIIWEYDYKHNKEKVINDVKKLLL